MLLKRGIPFPSQVHVIGKQLKPWTFVLRKIKLDKKVYNPNYTDHWDWIGLSWVFFFWTLKWVFTEHRCVGQHMDEQGSIEYGIGWSYNSVYSQLEKVRNHLLNLKQCVSFCWVPERESGKQEVTWVLAKDPSALIVGGYNYEQTDKRLPRS